MYHCVGLISIMHCSKTWPSRIRFGRVVSVSACAETSPKPDSKDPLRNDRIGLDSELTRPNRPSHDTTRIDSTDSAESAPSQGDSIKKIQT